ncbi:LytR C-terminal domain-containing protein [Patescibacteria group bacterium]|nr:LytR C-terminal domain-containing protein [Patescibacteria group bacterium]
MLFSKKTFLLAYLNNTRLKVALYSEISGTLQRIQLETLEFSEDTVKDGSIVSASLYYEQVTEALKARREWAGMDLVLVVPEEKIYIKGFELDLGDWEHRDELVHTFEDEAPFSGEELVSRERLVGRVFELSALPRQYIDDVQRPFLDARMRTVGVISVPHAAALIFQPKERSFLLSVHDTDLIMVLAENASVLMSGTKRMARPKAKEEFHAFQRFVQYAKAGDIKSVSLAGDGEALDDLKTELEKSLYAVHEEKKAYLLDLIASYYFAHRENEKEWNMLYAESAASQGKALGQRIKTVAWALGGVLVVLLAGWYVWGQIRSGMQAVPAPEATSTLATSTASAVPEATTTPAAPVLAKSDFPLTILNGTYVSGEAGRLRVVMTNAGYTVQQIGNASNQQQTTTTLSVPATMPAAFAAELRSLLEARYQTVTVVTGATASATAQITIGKLK